MQILQLRVDFPSFCHISKDHRIQQGFPLLTLNSKFKHSNNAGSAGLI